MSSQPLRSNTTTQPGRFFIACPMSSFETEPLYASFRDRVLRFCEHLATSPCTRDVFFAGRHISGFDAFDATADALQTDADAIWGCDHFVLLYPDRILSSALVEAGIALGLRKPMTIVCRDRADLPYVLRSGDISKSANVERLSIVVSDFSDDDLAATAHRLTGTSGRMAAE